LTLIKKTLKKDISTITSRDVGTKFEDIGELKESSKGKSTAMGGDARIHFALIQIYNAVHRAINNGYQFG
jgi:hypothetical protein